MQGFLGAENDFNRGSGRGRIRAESPALSRAGAKAVTAHMRLTPIVPFRLAGTRLVRRVLILTGNHASSLLYRAPAAYAGCGCLESTASNSEAL